MEKTRNIKIIKLSKSKRKQNIKKKRKNKITQKKKGKEKVERFLFRIFIQFSSVCRDFSIITWDRNVAFFSDAYCTYN